MYPNSNRVGMCSVMQSFNKYYKTSSQLGSYITVGLKHPPRYYNIGTDTARRFIYTPNNHYNIMFANNAII